MERKKKAAKKCKNLSHFLSVCLTLRSNLTIRLPLVFGLYLEFSVHKKGHQLLRYFSAP